MSAIFLLPVCLQYWPKKYTTRVDHNDDNFHQVRSWYDHPLPSYSVFVCWYVTWPCDLDLWPLTINTWSTWRVTWPTSPPSMNTLRLSVFSYELKRFPLVIIESAYAATAHAESRDTWVGGQKQLHFGDAWPRFTYSLCNFGGSTMKVIKVICENNTRLFVKRRMSFCTCGKSRDLLKVT